MSKGSVIYDNFMEFSGVFFCLKYHQQLFIVTYHQRKISIHTLSNICAVLNNLSHNGYVFFPYLCYYVLNLAIDDNSNGQHKRTFRAENSILSKILIKKSLQQFCHLQENEKILTTQFSTAKRFCKLKDLRIENEIVQLISKEEVKDVTPSIIL